MEVLIRPAEARDAADLAVLAVLLGRTLDAAEVRRRLERLAEIPEGALLVADEGGRAIGVAQVEIEHSFLTDGTALLRALAVAEDRRRLGVGARLVAAAERWAAERGAPFLRLRTWSDRAGAGAFYAALGYREQKLQRVFGKELEPGG